MEARQQADWSTARIEELQQSFAVGQLLRKYEGEVQRLRAQHDAERRDLQQQLAAAQQAATEPAPATPAAAAQPGAQQLASVDSAAWAVLFEDPSQPAAVEVADAWVQADVEAAPAAVGADPALLEAARVEMERLQGVNAQLLASQQHGR